MHNYNALPLPVAALSYALDGWRVFPCAPGAKTPLVAWSTMATDDCSVVADWWRLWPDANIGLAMGGGVAALDIDTKNGQRGMDSYALIDGPQDGRWPVQHTPSGGRHMLFRTDLTLTNFARRGAYGGLDMRTDGGYILAAPSRIGGVPYWWDRGGDLSAPLPERFAEVLAGWSRPTLGQQAPDVPEPTDLEDWEVAGRVAALGSPYQAFLQDGTTWSGDRSKDAYAAAMAGFSAGWTLADWARIGPDTYLAYFGGEAPHYANAPWVWAWKYCIAPAYRDWSAARAAMFEAVHPAHSYAISDAPGDGWQILDLGEEESIWAIEEGGEWGSRAESPTPDIPGVSGDINGPDSVSQGPPDVNPPATPATPATPDTYEAVQAAARALPRRDMAALDAWLYRALALPEPAYRIDALLLDARDASGFPGPICRNALDAARKRLEAHSGRPAPVPQGVPEIFVRSQDRFYDRVTRRWISKAALAAAKARDFQGDPDRVLDVYLYGPQALSPVVEDMTYDPGLAPGVGPDRNGNMIYNTYSPSHVPAVPGDVSPWLALLDALEIEGGRPVQERLLDEMAYVLQNPGVKVNHGIVLGGAEGIGKDSFLAPWLDAIGRSNVSIAHGSELESDFNAWLGHSKVCVINEVRFGTFRDRIKIEEKLKPLLASPPNTLSINEKNLRPYPVPNLVQLVLLTNHRDALSVNKNSRRYFCVWADRKAPTGHESEAFESYWTWMDNGGREAVHHWLLHRDVSAFKPGARPMDTEWLDVMSQLATDPLCAYMLERIAAGSGVFSGPVVLPQAVYDHLQNNAEARLYGIRQCTVPLIKRALQSLGFEKERIYHNGGLVDGYRVRVRHVDESPRELDGPLVGPWDNIIPFPYHHPEPKPVVEPEPESLPSWY